MAGPWIVIESAQQDGARAVVAPESLRDWELRGFSAVGPTSVNGRLQTDAEVQAAEEAEAARLAALLNPTSPKPARATTPKEL